MEKITPKVVNSADFDRLYPPLSEWSTLTLTCRRPDYSASELTRAVEDCDAHVLNLNVTSQTYGDNADPVIELRISHTNPAPVARSVARYGYDVLHTGSSRQSDIDDDTVLDRLNHLMRYLDV